MKKFLFATLASLGLAVVVGFAAPSANTVEAAPAADTWVCYTQTETLVIPDDQDLGDFVEASMELYDAQSLTVKPSSLATLNLSVGETDTDGFWVENAAEVYSSRYTQSWAKSQEFSDRVVTVHANLGIPVTIGVTAGSGSVVELKKMQYCNN